MLATALLVSISTLLAADGAPAATPPATPGSGPLPAAIRAVDDALLAAARPALGTVRKLRLAVIPVEFKDRKHDARFTTADFGRLIFSRDEYVKASPSGEPVFGSVADYYAENSVGRFALEGKVFDWISVRRERATYEAEGGLARGIAEIRFLTQALFALEAREGKSALDAFDSVCFLAAGPYGKHGSALWPHASGIPWRGRLLQYYLTSEVHAAKRGEEKVEIFSEIGVHAHELGHVLGILDKYGEGKHQGLGPWCLMAVGHRIDAVNGERRPGHLCAWCKAKLGWLAPATVDPRVRQTIRLRRVEGSSADAVKVLIDPDGSEYFLLENRQRTGFDGGTRPGLLIWHVGEFGQGFRNGVWAYSIDLEEAHGDETGRGPHVELDRVPWPQPGKTAFTPLSHPDTTSWNLGALRVAITEIRVEGEDVVFTIGEAAATSTPAVKVRE